MRPGANTADDAEVPDAEWLAMFGQVEPSLVTGTALDEFTPVYRALAKATDRHGPFSPSDIDGWDITTVAVVMGIDSGDSAWAHAFRSWESEYETWKATEQAASDS